MRNHKDQSNQNSKDNASSVDSVDSEGAYEAAQLIDNRTETTIQKKLNSLAENDPKAQKTAQLKSLANKSSENKKIIQKKENNTGLPDTLKSGVESLSGYSMDDVRVHKNSDKPAQLNAHAYAQGTEIHLAPGQEKHLPHETWHVAQQKQGRVKPTKQMKSKVNINDDQNLEREADIMGAKAMQLKPNLLETQNKSVSLQTPTVQRAWKETTSPEELYWDKEIDGLSWYCYADSDIMTFQVSNPDVMSSEDLAWYKSYEGQDYSYAEWINLFGSSIGISESSVPSKEMKEAAEAASKHTVGNYASRNAVISTLTKHNLLESCLEPDWTIWGVSNQDEVLKDFKTTHEAMKAGTILSDEVDDKFMRYFEQSLPIIKGFNKLGEGDSELAGKVVNRGDGEGMLIGMGISQVMTDLKDGKKNTVNIEAKFPGATSTAGGDDPSQNQYAVGASVIWVLTIADVHHGFDFMKLIGEGYGSENEITFPMGTKVNISSVITHRDESHAGLRPSGCTKAKYTIIGQIN